MWLIFENEGVALDNIAHWVALWRVCRELYSRNCLDGFLKGIVLKGHSGQKNLMLLVPSLQKTKLQEIVRETSFLKTQYKISILKIILQSQQSCANTILLLKEINIENSK